MSDANRPAGAVPDEQTGLPPAGEPGTVHVITTPTRTRMVLCGEIDIQMGADLADAASHVATAGLPVEVDTRHVTFMDSFGVTLLGQMAHRSRHRLTVIRPPDSVRFLLDVTQIADLVDIVDCVECPDDAPTR